MEAMEIKLKTLTPIWTGGVETGKMDRLHETGIIGSLRWWYEAIVRGLGGSACDPTSDSSCQFDAKAYEEAKKQKDPEAVEKGLAKVCPACRLFGCTGWRRRFQLVVRDNQLQEQPVAHPMKANRSYQDNRGGTRTPTWYFQNSPRAGRFSIQIQSLNPQFPVETIKGSIQFVTDWAALGARPQMGFGVLKMMGERLGANPFNTLALTNNNPDKNLPSLQNMFFARIHQPNASDQDTFNLKYDLRRLFANDGNVRHFVMGTVQGDRMGSKIFMSRPYGDGLIRVWGWIPEGTTIWNANWNRDKVLTQTKTHLTTNYKLITWREFNSSRDTNQQYTDMSLFLNSLWEGKE